MKPKGAANNNPVPVEHIYNCALCPYSTNNFSHYRAHLKTTHSSEKPFKCPECPYRSKWKSGIKRHVKNVHLLRSATGTARPFPCPHSGCNYAAKDNKNLTQHSKIHSDQTPEFACPHPNCNYSTYRKENFILHVRIHTGEKPWVCQFESCSYAAAQKGQLVTHSRIHTKEKPYKCPEANCEYAAAHRHAFNQHQLYHHPNPVDGEGEERPSFPCPLCEYSTRVKRNLSRHIKHRHTLEKFFKCEKPTCTFEGKTKGDIVRHRLVHFDEKPLACSFESCGFRCKRQGTLATHVRTHSEERRYKCELCPYRGKIRHAVTNHLKAVHSDPDFRPFKCTEPKCVYATKTKRDLNRHFSIHKGEKKYSCSFPLCDYKAINEQRIKLHQKAVHVTEKKYKCELCEFVTKTNGNLAKHVQTKTHRNKII